MIKEIENMDDDEFKEDMEKFDKLEDQLVAERDAGKEEKWIYMCPGCKQIVTRMTISGGPGVVKGLYYCNCGYPGPMAEIQESKIKDGSAIKELEAIEREYYRQNPGEYKKR
jgi:hypothetical protein